jgi:hypothetical protein
MIGGYIVTTPFAIAQGHPTYVTVKRIREGIRSIHVGPLADSGTFVRKTGFLEPDNAVKFWRRLTVDKGYCTLADVESYVGQVAAGSKIVGVGPLQLRFPGHPINELEIRLLFDMAAQITVDGERILTADRFVAFVDGTLWQDFAKARANKRIYDPRPFAAVVHEGAKKVATRLIALSGKAGPAIWDPPVTVDAERSLAEQQREKTIYPTLVGALLTALPFNVIRMPRTGVPAAAPGPSPVARHVGAA